MTSEKIRTLRAIILAWAVLSFLVALLPGGVGGVPRVVNAVLFMTLGPGCALMALLLFRRSLPAWSAALAGVVAIAASLTILVLSSQLLLMVGLWTVGSVAGAVTLATIALVLPSLVKNEGL
ncbi:MAG: hypothetical protein H0V42_11245 [Nocardioidaceae bacterium]|nr:hypothetical protein [Nocardioidaceae bacterium]